MKKAPEAQVEVIPSAQQVVQVVERLTDSDKAVLDASKNKRALALAEAKSAVAQSEVADLTYQNVILRLAMQYRLVDGDTITDTGEINRKSGV